MATVKTVVDGWGNSPAIEEDIKLLDLWLDTCRSVGSAAASKKFACRQESLGTSEDVFLGFFGSSHLAL